MAKRATHPIPRPFLLVLSLLAVNALLVDAWIIKTALPGLPAVLGMTDTQTFVQTSPCPQSCIDRINRVSVVPASAKEYYIPLGSGTNNQNVWTDVTSAQAYIDTSLYGTIKTVTFEATVAVPNGNQDVSVRLYNATAKHPVWYSDLSASGSGPTYLTSGPISLETGNNLYVVQMKNQLKDAASLLQARIHITTK